MEKNNLILPVAVIIARMLIAGGIYWGGKKDSQQNTNTYVKDGQKQKSLAINIKPVDANDHIVGNIDAKAIFVEYSDTECPFCKNFHETMNKLVADTEVNTDIAWVYRHFPIDSLHSKARKQSVATECANELGGNKSFWEYLNTLYKITASNNSLEPAQLSKIAKDIGLDTTKFDVCLNSTKYDTKIQESIDEASKIAGGTPTTIVILKNPAKKVVNDFISQTQLELAKQLPAGQDPSDLVRISEDNTKIFIGGALPFEWVKQLTGLIIN